MENTNTPEHTTGSGSCASPCSAVVEIAGDNVSVTLHPTDEAAEAFAVEICMENTAYTEDEIREHLKHRSDHAEGDYRVILATAPFYF
jgi:predicted secreted protein